MDTRQENRFTPIRFMTTAAIIIALSGFAGCSPSMTIGGYKHVDMSRSHYRDMIRQRADKLADGPTPRDKRVAAELYGSIEELELMDKCIAQYFEQEPSMGLYLLQRGKEIHKFYKSSP